VHTRRTSRFDGKTQTPTTSRKGKSWKERYGQRDTERYGQRDRETQHISGTHTHTHVTHTEGERERHEQSQRGDGYTDHPGMGIRSVLKNVAENGRGKKADRS
jgi:hypothetical protein